MMARSPCRCSPCWSRRSSPGEGGGRDGVTSDSSPTHVKSPCSPRPPSIQPAAPRCGPTSWASCGPAGDRHSPDNRTLPASTCSPRQGSRSGCGCPASSHPASSSVPSRPRGPAPTPGCGLLSRHCLFRATASGASWSAASCGSRGRKPCLFARPSRPTRSAHSSARRSDWGATSAPAYRSWPARSPGAASNEPAAPPGRSTPAVPCGWSAACWTPSHLGCHEPAAQHCIARRPVLCTATRKPRLSTRHKTGPSSPSSAAASSRPSSATPSPPSSPQVPTPTRSAQPERSPAVAPMPSPRRSPPTPSTTTTRDTASAAPGRSSTPGSWHEATCCRCPSWPR